VSENPYRKRGRPPQPNETAVERECAVHGLVVHHRYKEGEAARYRCKRCVGEAVTRRHRKLKRILVERFGGGCSVCGYSRCHGNLHFHHVDPSRKSFEIQMGLGKSLAAYLQEAEKCVLVCANCHGEIEAGLIPSPPAGSKLNA
jgi:hypothetical protein